MKLILLGVTLSFASVATAGVVLKSDAAFCQVLANHGLTNLDQHGCGNVKATEPIPAGAKDEACLALYHGGLTNLSSVGCGAHIGHTRERDDQNLDKPKLSSGHGPVFERSGRTHIVHAPPPAPAASECSSSKLCGVLQKGVVLDLNLMGCWAAELSLDEPAPCNKQACKIMQGALITANLFGC